MSLASKRLFLTGARFYVTLDLARQFHAYGHQVFVGESTNKTVCSYSNCIAKNFVIPSPRFETIKFINSLIAIVKEYAIDMLIPTFEETFYISQHLDRFPKECQILTMPLEILQPLHDKWGFIETLKNLGIKTPTTVLINTKEDLEKISFSSPYVLKACYCRASLNTFKIDPPNAAPPIQIEKHNPWIAQEWIDGTHYCSYSICHKGQVKAQATYPVEYAIEGKSCLTYRSINHSMINDWIDTFVKSFNYTGQIAFDFIQAKNGELYAIECNPRATSGVHLFSKEDRLIDAFLNVNQEVIKPKNNYRKQLAIGMLLYGWKNRSFYDFAKTVLSSTDVIFSKNDPKPFFAIPYVYGQYWTSGKKLNKTIPAAFTHDIEWNNELLPAGE